MVLDVEIYMSISSDLTDMVVIAPLITWQKMSVNSTRPTMRSLDTMQTALRKLHLWKIK